MTSVDRCLKSLKIDADKAIKVLKAYIRKVEMDRERARRNYVHKRDGREVEHALLV